MGETHSPSLDGDSPLFTVHQSILCLPDSGRHWNGKYCKGDNYLLVQSPYIQKKEKKSIFFKKKFISFLSLLREFHLY